MPSRIFVTDVGTLAAEIRAFRESVQDGTDKAAGALVQRELDVRPTLRVRPGWPLTVLVHRDLVLRPWRGPSGP